MLKLWVLAAALLAGAAAALPSAPGGAGLAPAADTDAAGAGGVPADGGPGRVAVLSAPGTTLAENIDAWIAELAKDEAFADWKGATWSKSPLGPGTHAWLVLVKSARDGGTLGYLIVAASPDGGFELAEYGAGESPPFSESVLRLALGSEGLEGVSFTEAAAAEPLYYDPVHVFWKVSENGTERYADAWTGAWLPIAGTDAGARKPAGGGSGDGQIDGNPGGKRFHTHVLQNAPDPYLSIAWLDAPDADIAGWEDFIAWFDARGGERMYAGAAAGGKLLSPAGVAGYHWWPLPGGGTGRYAALRHEGMTRYAPLEALLDVGTFR